MLWSELAIATLREDNHPLLVRAGYMRGREYLFLGQRTLAKIAAHALTKQHAWNAEPSSSRAGEDFVAESESGDEVLVRGTNYAALAAKAVGVAQPPAVPDPEGDLQPEEFHTPGVKTIAQIAEFTGLPATSQIEEPGDGAERRAAASAVARRSSIESGEAAGRAAGGTRKRSANWFGADPGSLGPVGISNVKIIADEALRGRRNMIAGANRTDYHLRNVTPGEDFAASSRSRQVVEGDTSITDGGPLQFSKVTLLDTPERILNAAVEQNHDADGLMLPAAIAPFTVVVTPVHPERLEAAREIYQRLLDEGHDALLDDRDARPGVKFKDADLIGFPYRINVGKKLAEGLVEIVERRSRKSTDVPVGEISIPR